MLNKAHRTALVLLAIIAAVGLRWLMDPLLEDDLPVASSFAAVALAVWLTGWRGGAAAAVTCYLACDFLFIEPRGSLALGGPPDVLGVALYVLACAVIIAIGEWMHRLQQAAAQQASTTRAQLGTVLDLLPLPAFIAGADGRLQSTNPAARELWGTAPPAAGPRPFGEEHAVWWPQTGRPVKPYEWGLTRAITHGEVVAGEEINVHMRRDGRRRTVLSFASPIKDPHGRILGGVAMQVDITERKLAEQSLRESERRFRLMADSAPVLIWMSGPDKLCTWFNKPWLEFVGRTQEQEHGNGWTENVHPDDFDRCLRTYTSAFDRRRPFTMEYRLRHYGGEYRWVLDNGAPRHDADGAFRGYIGSCIDITEHKLALADLAFQKFALDASSVVAITDARGDITYANDAFCEISGYSRDELIGRNHRMMKSGVHPDEFYRDLYRAITRGRVWRGEVCNRRKNGSLYWLGTTIVPSIGPDGRPDRFVTIRSDATERKLAEHASARHAEELAEAVRRTTDELTRAHQRQRATERIAAMGTLAAGLGHDMNNLMIPIRDQLDVLKDEPLTDRGRESIAAIGSSLSYLRNLARGLRMLSQDPAAAGHDTATDLAQWWSETQTLFKSVLPRAVRLDGDVAGGCVVLAAPHQITQIVYNLVQNAGEAMKDRGPGRVTLRAERVPAGAGDPRAGGASGPGVRLTVTDDGPGMTEEVRQRCMEPFYSTKQKSLIGGLGLSLVHSIVEAARGAIDLVTSPGRGASFIITLSAASPAPGEAGPDRPPPRPALVSVADPRLHSIIRWVLGSLDAQASAPMDPDTRGARLWIADEQSRPEALAFAARGDGVAVILAEPQHEHPGDGVLMIGAHPTPKQLREVLTDALARAEGPLYQTNQTDQTNVAQANG